jgi:hypothetical protein
LWCSPLTWHGTAGKLCLRTERPLSLPFLNQIFSSFCAGA